MSRSSDKTQATMEQPAEQTGHTPGPWQFDGQSILAGNMRHILRDGVGWSQADARLIAAAPDLLAACKLALVSVPDFETAEKRRNVCRAAIAKAEGQTGGREMNTARGLKKALEAKKAKSEQFKSQTIPVDEKWQVVRADELNWEVQHRNEAGEWKFNGYFGRLIDAFKSLPHKMLGSAAKDSIGNAIELQKAINAKIEKAFELAEKEGRLLA